MSKLKENNKEIVSYSRYIRMSPFKIRRIIDQIRGRSSNEALMILKFMPYKACPIISKTILSALANAKQTYNIDGKFLYISEAKVDEGPADRKSVV